MRKKSGSCEVPSVTQFFIPCRERPWSENLINMGLKNWQWFLYSSQKTYGYEKSTNKEAFIIPIEDIMSKKTNYLEQIQLKSWEIVLESQWKATVLPRRGHCCSSEIIVLPGVMILFEETRSFLIEKHWAYSMECCRSATKFALKGTLTD